MRKLRRSGIQCEARVGQGVSRETEVLVVWVEDWLRCEHEEMGGAQELHGQGHGGWRTQGSGRWAGPGRGQVQGKVCTMGQGILGEAMMTVTMTGEEKGGQREEEREVKRGEEGGGEAAAPWPLLTIIIKSTSSPVLEHPLYSSPCSSCVTFKVFLWPPENALR